MQVEGARHKEETMRTKKLKIGSIIEVWVTPSKEWLPFRVEGFGYQSAGRIFVGLEALSPNPTIVSAMFLDSVWRWPEKV